MENYIKKDLVVRCPNLCFSGQEKIHDQNKAFFTFTKCKYCNGKGVVKESDYDQINNSI